MQSRFLLFAALVLVGLSLIPAGAHVFEMPAKLALGREAYFTVQQIYRGWALFGVPIIAALLVCLALAVILCGSRRLLALIATAGIAGSLLVFFVFVFPGNQATTNWSVQPENWEQLRQSWEYGHAASAACLSVSFLALAILAVFRPVD